MIPDFPPATTGVAEVIRSRRTIHDFEQRQPPLQTILQAVELARWAPNHKMTEPWRFHLLGPEAVHEIIALNTRLIEEEKGSEAAARKYRRWSAIPGWMAVGSLRSDDPLRDQENYAAVCCAIQNLTLYLWSEQVGVKWSTGPVTHHERLYEILNVDPREQNLVGLLWYGYPANVPQMKRLDLDQIVRILS